MAFPLNHHIKRGLLINALGGIMKLISGNLDRGDARQFDETINGLKTNQRRIIK